jgi:FMN phosphatase YigB (HAD superfamily)
MRARGPLRVGASRATLTKPASGKMRKLKSAGLRTAILSNGSPAMLEAVVNAAKLNDVLDAVIVGRRGQRLQTAS